MRCYIRIILAFTLAIIMTSPIFAEIPSDSVKVFFRVGHRQYDPAFGDNRQAMDGFMNILSKACSDDDVESIVIRAYTSPDGTSSANQRLSELRCDAIADYITDHLDIDHSLIQKKPEGIAWDGLRKLVAETPGVPSRDAVLDILDNTPVWVFDSNGKVIDGRKSRLMSLDRGVPYRWMLANLFPQLRNAVVISIIIKEPSIDQQDSVSSQDTVLSQDPESLQSARDSETSETTEISEPSEPSVIYGSKDLNVAPCHDIGTFAIKTNLLYDAALMPNIQFEWMFHDRWSVALETGWAWWARHWPHKVYRLGFVLPEVRYWAINHSRLHGLYVGAFVGSGLYDLCDAKKGYKGEGFMAGVSCGYMWPISRHFSLDAGVGIGYLRTHYKEYKPYQGHFLYVQTKRLNYFGLLSLRLSLSWIIPSCRQTSTEKSVK